MTIVAIGALRVKFPFSWLQLENMLTFILGVLAAADDFFSHCSHGI